MPINDLISREAAIAAVEKLICTYEAALDKLTAKESCHESHVEFIAGASNGALAAKDAINTLPADRRWDELRAWIERTKERMRADIRDTVGEIDDRMVSQLFALMQVTQTMDRLAPPADGAENT